MKKSILTIAILSITTLSFAQVKQDTAKKAAIVVKAKPEFKLDPAKVYDIHLQLTAQQLQVLTTPDSELEGSDRLSGAQILQLKDFKKDTWKDAARQAGAQANADYLKFKADTTTVNKAKPKK